MASISINPIVIGTSDVYNHPSSQKIQQISKNDKDAYWFAYNSLVYPSYILMNGGKVINAVNFYEDEKKWDIIDPSEKKEKVYNRYAHFIITFSEDDKVRMKNPIPDVIEMKLPFQAIIDLNVKYILTKEELDIQNDEYQLSKIYQDTDCIIYQIKGR